MPEELSAGTAEIATARSPSSPPNPLPQPHIPPILSSLVDLKPSAKKTTVLSHVKAWTWRVTSGYFWLHSVLLVIAGRDALAGIENFITAEGISILSLLGFTPVHVSHLLFVFSVIWLLAITEFSPIQLVGFLLYFLVFPVTVLGAWIFRKTLRDSSEVSPVTVTTPDNRHFPTTSLLTALLVGWFALYGGSSARGPNMAGFLIAAVLFLALVYQALDKTSPVDDRDTAFFTATALRGLLLVSNTFKSAAQTPPTTKIAVAGALRINGFVIGGFRRVGVLIHGRKGRERIAMTMLLEYIVFLLMVAASAILMWALAIKATVPSEQALPLTVALRLSASHFLPGIQDSSATVLPWWAQFGPALTSWILFVVYIGPVGSTLPMQQQAILKQLAATRPAFQIMGRIWRHYRNFLKMVEKRVPPK